MKIKISDASLDDLRTIQNLWRFYAYDMSRFCGFLKGWEMPSDGLYTCIDLSPYWKEPNRYPFLIHVDYELAGFALISQIKTQKNYWNVDDFFVVAKYQRKGVGRTLAEHLFEKFPGDWVSMQIPENTPAISFWENVMEKYTSGVFQKTTEIIPEPTPHPMLVLKFHSSIKV